MYSRQFESELAYIRNAANSRSPRAECVRGIYVKEQYHMRVPNKESPTERRRRLFSVR